MSTMGKRLLSRIVFDQDRLGFLRMELYPELFKGSEVDIYSLVSDHVLNFGVIPSQDTIEYALGDVLVEAPEPAEYYLKEVEKRFLQSSIRKMVIEASEALTNQDPQTAFDGLVDQISELGMMQRRRDILDFREVASLIHAEYMTVKKGEDGGGVLFGWNTLDEMTGGLRAGDFCSVVGRPASGKTFMLLYMANNCWNRGGVPLVVSMEMMNTPIAQRLSAMCGHKSLTQLMKGMLTTASYKALQKILLSNREKEHPFWLIDGNLAATVEDVVMLCRQLKPTAVWVDGAYLLRHSDRRLSRWDRMTENAEGLKQRVASDLKLPVITSYQFNKEVLKKKSKGFSEKAGVEDIYGSDAIGQLSSVALGLFEPETLETQMRRKVEVLKGRNGESGEFLINWDFRGMNFDEVSSKKNEQGELIANTEELNFW